MKQRSRPRFLVALASFLPMLPLVAQAQATAVQPALPRPGDIAPKVETPKTDASKLPPSAETGPAPKELEKPGKDLTIDVIAFAVDESAPAELRAALPGITARYTGKGRHYEDLVDAAADVGRFLQRELGDYLGYAYIPEQSPQAGVVRIAILEGRLDHVELVWKDSVKVDRNIVERYLSLLQPGAILKVGDVERVVFLINDLRGVNAQFEVKQGSRPGTATLVVTPQSEPNFGAHVDLDADGSRYLGPYRLGATATWNSPAGRGDALTANLLASNNSGLQFGLLGYTMPIGGQGLKAGLNFSLVQYKINPNAVPGDLKGNAATANAYLLYPAVRSRNFNQFVVGALDQKNYDDKNTQGSTRKDSTSFTLGTSGDFRDALFSGGVNTFEFNASFGRLHFPAGQATGSDVATSYSKANFSLTRLQNLLSGRMLLYLAAHGQAAFANLDSTEQFRLGGPDGIRAFAPGEGTGDYGGMLTTELRFLPPESLLGRLAKETVFSLFYDIGHIQARYKPAASGGGSSQSPRSQTLTGIGVGGLWSRPSEYSLRVNIAHPLSGTPVSDPKRSDVRLYSEFSVIF